MQATVIYSFFTIFTAFTAGFFVSGNAAYAQGAAPTLPAPAAGASYALPADHLLEVLKKTSSTPSRVASDASEFSGTVKIGGASVAASSALMIGHAAVAGVNRESMKSQTAQHGIVIYSPDYEADSYFPGIVWETGNNNAAKPKIGIWGQMTAAGSKLYFGTSNSYSTGITNQALTIDQSGRVGIGFTNPARALVVSPLTTDGTVARFIGNPWTGSGNTSRIELGDNKHYLEAKWGGPFTIDSVDNISIQPTNGNVGIGTSAPTELLQLGDGIAFHNGGHKLISFGWSPGNGSKALRTGFPAEIRWNPLGYLQFGIDTTSHTIGQSVIIPSLLTLHESGNVGVGMVTPWQKLDVAGNASLTGGLYVSDWLASRNNNSGLRFFTNKNNQWQERMRVSADGKVGIGTADPEGALDVSGDIILGKAGEKFIIHPRTETGDFLQITNQNGNGHWLWGQGITLRDNGNVGIGTSDPKVKLHVNGGHIVTSGSLFINDYIAPWYNDRGIRFFSRPADGKIAERMTITPDGKIGIGTANPKGKFHLAGDLIVGNDTNDQKFIIHPRDGFNGDFLHITNDDGSGSWVWTQGIVLKRGGNVGIGKENPQYKLDVNGIVNVTEIYKNGSPLLMSKWTTSGNNIYYNTGNVGIGITNPDRALVVKPSSSSGIVALFAGNPWMTAGNTSRIELGDAQHYLEAKWGGPFTIQSADNIVIQSGRGKVGVGTIAPTDELHVKGKNDNADIRLEHGTNGKKWNIGAGDKLWIASMNYPNSGSYNDRLVIDYGTGNVGIGVPPHATHKLNVKGSANVAFSDNQQLARADGVRGFDVAELFDAEEDVEAGDIVVVGRKEKHVRKSSRAYEDKILGIVSTAPAILFEGSEIVLADSRIVKNQRKPAVALSGRVPVKVSLENGLIVPGDYLTSASTPGVAMRATEDGPTLGIALEGFRNQREGTIIAFLALDKGGIEDHGKKIETLFSIVKELQKEIDGLRSRIIGHNRPR